VVKVIHDTGISLFYGNFLSAKESYWNALA
jgi:hypothetical protein